MTQLGCVALSAGLAPSCRPPHIEGAQDPRLRETGAWRTWKPTPSTHTRQNVTPQHRGGEGRRPADSCSRSPVRAAGGQEVLIGVKLYHVDRPRVTREFRHHLAGSQIPELGTGRVGVMRRTDTWLPALPLIQPLPTLPGLRACDTFRRMVGSA